MPTLQFFLRSLMGLMLIFMVAVSADMLSGAAYAQTAGTETPVQGSTPGGVNDGSSSDSELWRAIRRGDSGTVVGGDKSGGMMIQSGGQDWRLLRNGPLPRYAAWAILGTLLLLALFFALRGRIKIDHGPSGKTMKRFSMIERAGHWLLASSFILLSLTGLNLIFGKTLLIPLLGKEAFASITVFGKYIHNYVGFAFMLGLVMITIMWIVHNIPNMHDVKWLLRGGGVIGDGHPPAKKFNAGQKIIFWIVVLCGISISMSGWALMNPFSTQMFSGTFDFVNSIFGTSYATDLNPIQEQQYQSLWHAIMAVFMTVVILAHIYIGSVGMEGALSAMTTGEVDTNWAKEHHSLWVEEEAAKGNLPDSSSGTETSALAGASAALAGGAAASMKKSGASSNAGSPGSEPVTTAIFDPSVTKTISTRATKKPATAKQGSRRSTSTAVAKPAAQTAKPRIAKSNAATRVGSAKATAATRQPARRKTATASRTRAKDDLKLIKGIGPQNEQRLNKIGVRKFEDVAKWTKKDQADIGTRLSFPGRIEREEWVRQAKILARKEK